MDLHNKPGHPPHPTLFLFYEYSVSVIVTEHTNYSLETIMAWYRGFKEDCPDGRLTPQAFMHVYGSSFVSANTKEFCDYVFRNFDKDGNGYIDFKEFLLAIHVTSSGSAEDKLKWAFRCSPHVYQKSTVEFYTFGAILNDCECSFDLCIQRKLTCNPIHNLFKSQTWTQQPKSKF